MARNIRVAARLGADRLQLRAQLRLLHDAHQRTDLPQRLQFLYRRGRSLNSRAV